MPKRIFALLLCCLVAACGAPIDDDDDEEIGTSHQTYNAPVSPNYQLGTQTGSARQRCNRTASGQVCSIPHSRTLKYCVDFPLGAAIESDIVGDTAARAGAIGWTFTKVADCGDANIQFSLSSVGASGTASNDVKDYVTVLFSNTTSLSENELPGEAEVVGQYQKHTSCNVRIDKDDILAKGTSNSQDQNGWRHAAMNGLGKCIGIGGRTINAQISSRNLFDLNTIAVALSPGEDCVLSGYSPINNGNFFNAGTCSTD